MKLIICDSYEEGCLEGAKIILDVVKSNPKAVLGLATGSTPIGVYKEMVKDFKDNHTSYKDVISYNLDEYFGLEGTHPQSYRYFMEQHLFQYLDIDPANVHVPLGHGDIEKNADDYNAMLDKDVRDIQLLGIGSNGHIGFNEPGESFDSITHVVDLKESTIQDNAKLFFDGDIDAVPKKAITMGIKNIMDAKKILLMAFGINKRYAIKELVEGTMREEVPATILQKHDDVIVIVDKEAAIDLLK